MSSAKASLNMEQLPLEIYVKFAGVIFLDVFLLQKTNQSCQQKNHQKPTTRCCFATARL